MVADMWMQMQFNMKFEVLSDGNIPSLPDGLVPASPVLRLTSELRHGTKFPKPVRIYLPVCPGAEKALRKSEVSDEWQPVNCERLKPGCMLLRLDSFSHCAVFTDVDQSEKLHVRPFLQFTAAEQKPWIFRQFGVHQKKSDEVKIRFALEHLACPGCRSQAKATAELKAFRPQKACFGS